MIGHTPLPAGNLAASVPPGQPALRQAVRPRHGRLHPGRAGVEHDRARQRPGAVALGRDPAAHGAHRLRGQGRGALSAQHGRAAAPHPVRGARLRLRGWLLHHHDDRLPPGRRAAGGALDLGLAGLRALLGHRRRRGPAPLHQPRAGRNRLRELRAERGWTQAHLAELLRVSRQTVNAIETGRYDPSLPLAFDIADVFEARIEDLFSRDRDDQPAHSRR